MTANYLSGAVGESAPCRAVGAWSHAIDKSRPLPSTAAKSAPAASACGRAILAIALRTVRFRCGGVGPPARSRAAAGNDAAHALSKRMLHTRGTHARRYSRTATVTPRRARTTVWRPRGLRGARATSPAAVSTKERVRALAPSCAQRPARVPPAVLCMTPPRVRLSCVPSTVQRQPGARGRTARRSAAAAPSGACA